MEHATAGLTSRTIGSAEPEAGFGISRTSTASKSQCGDQFTALPNRPAGGASSGMLLCFSELSFHIPSGGESWQMLLENWLSRLCAPADAKNRPENSRFSAGGPSNLLRAGHCP